MDFVILGTAQDGGIPHAGCLCNRCARAAATGIGARFVASAAVVDASSGAWCLLDPSPDLPRQFARLAAAYKDSFRLSFLSASVFVTHIHLGHYWGLGFLGKEGAGTRGVPVYAGPRAAEFLRRNDPFRRIAEEGRIRIESLSADVPWKGFVEITPVAVPHREDFSETFGFLVQGPSARVFYMPDADCVDARIASAVSTADYAYVDGTFFSPGEIPGLSDGTVPHPPMSVSAEILGSAGSARTRIRYTHMNHTNPALNPDGPERKLLEEKGLSLAEDFETVAI